MEECRHWERNLSLSSSDELSLSEPPSGQSGLVEGSGLQTGAGAARPSLFHAGASWAASSPRQIPFVECSGVLFTSEERMKTSSLLAHSC